MNAPVATPKQFNRGNESAHRNYVEDELGQKHDKRSDIIVPFGRRIVFLDENGSAGSLKLVGGRAQFSGDLDALGRITQGEVQWPVALQPRVVSVADGETITWHPSGAALNAVPSWQIVPPVGVLVDSSIGEAWGEATFVSTSLTGGTLRLRINVPGATATVTSTTDSAGGVGDPARVMDKSDAADTYDGVYRFRAQGTVTVTGTLIGEGSSDYINIGSATFSTWFNDGGGWDEGPSFVVDYFTSGPSDDTGAQAFDTTVDVAWSAAVGLHGGKEFGVSHESGGSLTDFVSVEYTKQASTGDRTGSPNGEKARVIIVPDNSF